MFPTCGLVYNLLKLATRKGVLMFWLIAILVFGFGFFLQANITGFGAVSGFINVVITSVFMVGGVLGALLWYASYTTKRDERLKVEQEEQERATKKVAELEQYNRQLATPPEGLKEICENYEAIIEDLGPELRPEIVKAYEQFSQAALARVIDPSRLDREFDERVMPFIEEAYGRAVFPDRIHLGNSRWPVRSPVCVGTKSRFKHTYIIGATGTGKTTLLKRLILADIKSGHGVTVLMPDRTFITDDLMPYIDARRVKDVIYFNPEDAERPVTFNPLALQPYENIDRKADELLTLFKRAIGDTSPRMDAILRNSFYALLERRGSTLNDMYELLAPAKHDLRNEIISTTQDEKTRDFFQSEYLTYPKDAARPILNRLDALTRASFLKNALCQPQSSLNFQEAMNQRKIVLCNLSDGAMGTQNATLLGQLLIASIQQALFARDTQPEVQRVPHFLYIDEFETYTAASTTALSEILTRARKLKLGITIAHQNLDQIPNELLASILGNTETLFSFRVSHKDANKLGPQFDLDPNKPPFAIRKELRGLEDETEKLFGSKIWHKPWFTELKVGEVWLRLGADNYTALLKTIKDATPGTTEHAEAVVRSSRERYGQDPIKAAPPPRQRTAEPEATADPSPEPSKQPKAVKEQKEKPAEFDPYQLE